MYHDSTRCPEKEINPRDWTEFVDTSDTADTTVITFVAPSGKAKLLGKNLHVTILDEMARLPYDIEIKKVIFNPPATVVIWSDGEKTVVKTSKDDVFSKETGLAMAIAKRYFGSRSGFLKAVESAEGDAEGGRR